MSKKIAINGFGRIGRNAFKLAFERDDIEVVDESDALEDSELSDEENNDDSNNEQ